MGVSQHLHRCAAHASCILELGYIWAKYHGAGLWMLLIWELLLEKNIVDMRRFKPVIPSFWQGGPEEHKRLSRFDFYYLLDQLEKIHALNIVHQNIIVENIMFDEHSNRTLFIDFASASNTTDPPSKYNDTMVTAIHRIFEILSKNEHAVLKLSPIDELKVFVKTMFIYAHAPYPPFKCFPC